MCLSACIRIPLHPDVGWIPLEGLEHVLSIVICDINRQNSPNHADSSNRADMKRRPKTASNNWDAAKMRPEMGLTRARLRACCEHPHSTAFASKFDRAVIEQIAPPAARTTYGLSRLLSTTAAMLKRAGAQRTSSPASQGREPSPVKRVHSHGVRVRWRDPMEIHGVDAGGCAAPRSRASGCTSRE